MRLSVIQMDMRLGESAYNFAHAEALLRRAAAEGTDTALLPETWNTGFFPADHLPERSDRGGEAVKALCAPLARELNMNIVAGCNSCGTAGETVFGGASRILGPRGELLAAAGAGEEIVTAALDFSVLAEVRNSINVFHDRRPELYRL